MIVVGGVGVEVEVTGRGIIREVVVGFCREAGVGFGVGPLVEAGSVRSEVGNNSERDGVESSDNGVKGEVEQCS